MVGNVITRVACVAGGIRDRVRVLCLWRMAERGNCRAARELERAARELGRSRVRGCAARGSRLRRSGTRASPANPATNPASYANPASRTIPPATLIPPATQAITRVPGIAILVSRAPRERGCALANHTNSVRYPILKRGLLTFYSNYRNLQFLSICYKL